MALIVGDRVRRTYELCSRLSHSVDQAQWGTVVTFDDRTPIVEVAWDGDPNPRGGQSIHVDNLVHTLIVQEEPF